MVASQETTGLTMNLACRVGALLIFALFSTPALPWGAEGHQAVGAIADQLLAGSPAGQKVKEILGFELRQAGPWMDCLRDVQKQKDGTFKYTHNPKFGASCVDFKEGDEKARMEDYARRNWTNCKSVSTPPRPCHTEYHFADVNVQHFDYCACAGKFPHDIVRAINAAVAVLQDKPAPAPFSIKDKKEAIFFLAHFLGDLHQPLHVGAVYLNPKGRLLNPDGKGGLKKASETHGGNSILDGKANMHSEWDAIPKDLHAGPDKAVMQRAQQIAVTPGEIDTWAASWASDTLRAAPAAFIGVSFSGAGKKWNAHYADRNAYQATQSKLKREQLAKGGARLAQIFKVIWP